MLAESALCGDSTERDTWDFLPKRDGVSCCCFYYLPATGAATAAATAAAAGCGAIPSKH